MSPSTPPTKHTNDESDFVGTRFTSNFAVRPDDLDLFKHVHSSRYQDYLLAARFDQMKRCYGISMEAFMEKGLGWFVSDFRIQYKDQLGLGDEFAVTTWVETFKAATITVGFEIQRTTSPEALCCQGESRYVLINLETGRPTRIPDWVKTAYEV